MSALHDAQSGQAQSDRDRRHLENIALDYHTAPTRQLESLRDAHDGVLKDLGKQQQQVWWDMLVVAAGEVARLELEREQALFHSKIVHALDADGEIRVARTKVAQLAYAAVIANQTAAERPLRELVSFCEEYANARPEHLAELDARYAGLLPNLTPTERARWLNVLVDAVDKCDRLTMERDHADSHLARRAAADGLPAAEFALRQSAYFALMWNGKAAKAGGGS